MKEFLVTLEALEILDPLVDSSYVVVQTLLCGEFLVTLGTLELSDLFLKWSFHLGL